jgi:hypothetical protein
MEDGMKLTMHPSVQKIAEYMQAELPADQLAGVARALSALAPVLWGQYPVQDICPLKLVHEPIISPAEHIPPAAT